MTYTAAAPRDQDPPSSPGGGDLNTPSMSSPKQRPSTAWQYQVADNVIALRSAHGWTQQQLADRCHRTRPYIANIEQGRLNLTLATLEILAEGLDCLAVDLVADCRPSGRNSHNEPAGHGSAPPRAEPPGETTGVQQPGGGRRAAV
jgi:transcriptional regulator with XRE-family HTH domain